MCHGGAGQCWVEKWTFYGLGGQGGLHFRKEIEHQLEGEDCLHFPVEMSLFSDMEITTSSTSIHWMDGIWNG